MVSSAESAPDESAESELRTYRHAAVSMNFVRSYLADRVTPDDLDLLVYLSTTTASVRPPFVY